ncbi:hypothetical protein AMTRI_Chr03g48840 [Amborella trichopoda]
MKEQTSTQEVPIEVEGRNLHKAQDTPILDSRVGLDDPNLEVIDSQIKIEKLQEKSLFQLKKRVQKTFRTSL